MNNILTPKPRTACTVELNWIMSSSDSVFLFRCTHMAVCVSIQYDGGSLPDCEQSELLICKGHNLIIFSWV